MGMRIRYSLPRTLGRKEKVSIANSKSSYIKRLLLDSISLIAMSFNMNRSGLLMRYGQSRPATARTRALRSHLGA